VGGLKIEIFAKWPAKEEQKKKASWAKLLRILNMQVDM